MLGLEAPSDWQITLPPLPPIEQAEVRCDICNRVFVHQMALRQHMRLRHTPAVSSALNFNIALDAVKGLPQCRHCGEKFRFWQGLKQHLDKDTCPRREDRARVHANPPDDSKDLPLVSDLLVREAIQLSGAESLLDNADLCLRLSQACVVCTRWCPTGGALAHHSHHAHSSDYLAGKSWAMSRLKSRAITVTNPCTWCSKPFASSTILQKHYCHVLVQLGILAYRAELAQEDHAGSSITRQSAATSSAAAAATTTDGGCRAGSGSLSLSPSMHVRQHQARDTVRRRPSRAASAAAAATKCTAQRSVAFKEGAEHKPSRRLRCKTPAKSLQGRQSQQQQQQQQSSVIGGTMRDHGKGSHEARGCGEQNSPRYGVCSTPSNDGTNSEVTSRYIKKVEGRDGDRPYPDVATSSHLAGAMLLLRDSAAVQDDCGLRPEQRQAQEALRRRDHRQQASLLQDQVELGEAGGGAGWSRPRSCGTRGSTRTSGTMAQRCRSHSSISLNETSGTRIPRKDNKFHVGAEPTSSAGWRGVSHHGDAMRLHGSRSVYLGE